MCVKTTGFSFDCRNLMVVLIILMMMMIIIIIYLTANGLSPGGSGYNACT